MAGKQHEKSDAEMQINFSALKKHDQNIQQIIDTASSVAHYKFNSSSGVWEKTEVEGSLFLYSRKTSPYVIIFIMNRLNKDNAKLTLTPDMEFKIQEPFLLCKASNSEIIGIWFYDCAECRRFGALLSRFRVLAKDERSLQISIMMEAQKNAKTNDSSKNGIIGMFTQAQDEYTKTRSKFAQEQQTFQKSNQKNKEPTKHNKIVLHRGISEPNLRLSNSPNMTITEQLEQKSPTYDKEEQIRKQRERFKEEHKKEQEVLFNILHGNSQSRNRTLSSGGEFDSAKESSRNSNLISNAGDLATFNELGIISEQNLISNYHVKEKAIDCAELESQFSKQIRGECIINQPDVLDRISNIVITDNNKVSDFNKSGIAISRSNEFLTTGTPHSSVYSSLQSNSAMQGIKSSSKPVITNVASLGGSLNNTTIMPSSNIPAGLSANLTTDLSSHLLSPHVMTSSKGRGTTLSTLANGQQNVALAANFKQGNKVNKKLTDSKGIFPEAPSAAALRSLMAPAAFQLTSPNVNKSDGDTSNINKNGDCEISKKEFQSILLNMIQTDNEFVTKLHNAFLEKLQQK